DTMPAMYPYEMAGWGSIGRYTAYATAALGDPVMAMRVRDALAALAWLRTRPEVDKSRVFLTANGLGAVVALHAAAIDKDLAGVVLSNGLSSFRSLIAAEHYPWSADAFIPNVLKYYDLPDLAAAILCPVHAHNLRGGNGEPADNAELKAWRKPANVTLSTDTDEFSLAAWIELNANG
ncbi:MAG: alpha/beta hydrolase family protein, partial [Candidatus Pacebacteria bacterium]|nr:alpha/beta hydrolase family protein [Candidatus Paceibacterota bacterium]